MLALPLGMTYFVVLITGLSVGLGVAIVTFGLPVVLVMWMARQFARLERWLTGGLLGLDMPDPYRPALGGWWSRLLSRIADPATSQPQHPSDHTAEPDHIQDHAHPDVLLTNAMYALNEGRITDTILSFPSAKKPMDRPSGDQNGTRALSVPVSGRMSGESSDRSQR